MDGKQDHENPATDRQRDALSPSPRESAVEGADLTKQTAGKGATQPDTATELKREFKIFEIASFVVQILLAVIGIGALCIYNGQLKVMRGTLDEMKRSGTDSTNQAWQAIGNMNWLARTMDGSLRQSREAMRRNETEMKKNLLIAKEAMDRSERQAKASLDASIEATRNEQRAWIASTRVSINQPRLGQALSGEISLENIGKTPANVYASFVAISLSERDFGPLSVDDASNMEIRKITSFENPFVAGQLDRFAKPFTTSYVMSPSDMRLFDEDIAVVYVFGTWMYLDIFDNRRVTDVCIIYKHLGRGSTVADTCGQHNRMK